MILVFLIIDNVRSRNRCDRDAVRSKVIKHLRDLERIDRSRSTSHRAAIKYHFINYVTLACSRNHFSATVLTVPPARTIQQYGKSCFFDGRLISLARNNQFTIRCLQLMNLSSCDTPGALADFSSIHSEDGNATKMAHSYGLPHRDSDID